LVRRKFAAYWRVIYPGSALIRVMWFARDSPQSRSEMRCCPSPCASRAPKGCVSIACTTSYTGHDGFSLSDHQKLIRDTVRQFRENEVPPGVRQRTASTLPVDEIKKIAELGCCGMMSRRVGAARGSTPFLCFDARRSRARGCRDGHIRWASRIPRCKVPLLGYWQRGAEEKIFAPQWPPAKFSARFA